MHTLKFSLLSAFFLALASAAGAGQQGQADPSFGSNGRLVIDTAFASEEASSSRKSSVLPTHHQAPPGLQLDVAHDERLVERRLVAFVWLDKREVRKGRGHLLGAATGSPGPAR